MKFCVMSNTERASLPCNSAKNSLPVREVPQERLSLYCKTFEICFCLLRCSELLAQQIWVKFLTAPNICRIFLCLLSFFALLCSQHLRHKFRFVIFFYQFDNPPVTRKAPLCVVNENLVRKNHQKEYPRDNLLCRL